MFKDRSTAAAASTREVASTHLTKNTNKTPSVIALDKGQAQYYRL